MSCGNHHDVPCQDFLAEVYLFLDCECDEHRRSELDQHLRECHPCLEKYGIERDLKSLVRRGCAGEKAPEELRLRLLEQIKAAGFFQRTETVISGNTVEQTTVRISSTPRDLER